MSAGVGALRAAWQYKAVIFTAPTETAETAIVWLVLEFALVVASAPMAPGAPK